MRAIRYPLCNEIVGHRPEGDMKFYDFVKEQQYSDLTHRELYRTLQQRLETEESQERRAEITACITAMDKNTISIDQLLGNCRKSTKELQEYLERVNKSPFQLFLMDVKNT